MSTTTAATILTPDVLAKIDGNALPTPTVSTPFSFHDRGRPSRSRRVTYLIDNEPGRGDWTVQVRVGHDQDRKQFDATLYVVLVQSEGNFSVEKFALIAGVRIASEPVARFSTKALDAFTSDVVTAMPDVYKVSQAVVDRFDLARAHRLDDRS